MPWLKITHNTTIPTIPNTQHRYKCFHPITTNKPQHHKPNNQQPAHNSLNPTQLIENSLVPGSPKTFWRPPGQPNRRPIASGQQISYGVSYKSLSVLCPRYLLVLQIAFVLITHELPVTFRTKPIQNQIKNRNPGTRVVIINVFSFCWLTCHSTYPMQERACV